MTLGTGDWIVIAVYVGIVAAITIWHTAKTTTTSEFLLAGRRLTLPIFVATLVSTWYGGIFGISEFTEYYGLGAWLVQGIFWYIIYAVFALFIAEKIRSMPFYTIPDILENNYGKKAAFVGGIFTYIMVNPAPYLLSLGILIAYFSPLTLVESIIISTCLCIIYTYLAGFRGVVYTDLFQFMWMFLAFIVLFYLAYNEWGGIEFLQKNLPETHLQITGGMSTGVILVWAGLACWVFVDPNFYQRCAAAKNPKTAKHGILTCIAFWLVFDIVAIGSAMYGFAALSAGELSIPPGNNKYMYLALADHLMSSPLKGLFVAGIVSTIMSTADSFLFVAAVNISRDYYWRYLNREASDEKVVVATRIAILITAVFSAALAIALPKVTQLWYALGNIGLSALLISMLRTFYGKKHGGHAALASMFAGAAVACLWLLFGLIHMKNGFPVYPLGVEPLYPGLLLSYLAYEISGRLSHESNSKK
ncbi:sodium:solute symporter [Candidatus Uabimicrobium sp. HlEnr_7]|uniref:sodium:solute symporter family protein n=1 Tax=Candidatus Uabimicrobium helgolandensis TaxID=3095367 RepID=UPI003558280B